MHKNAQKALFVECTILGAGGYTSEQNRNLFPSKAYSIQKVVVVSATKSSHRRVSFCSQVNLV